MDVAIHAVLNPEHLAGRGTRMIWPQSGIYPGKIVEDADGTDGLIDDIAAAAGFNWLRECTHGAGLAFRVPGGCANAAFES